jgi:hypothetical protein
MLLDRAFFHHFSTIENAWTDFKGREPYHKKPPCPNAFTSLCSGRATFIQSASMQAIYPPQSLQKDGWVLPY